MTSRSERFDSIAGRYIRNFTGDNLRDAIEIRNNLPADPIGAAALWDMVHCYVSTGHITGDLTDFIRMCFAYSGSSATPIIPYFSQMQVMDKLIEKTSNPLFINCSRQLGTTTILAAYALHQALSDQRHNVLILTTRMNESYEFINRARFMIGGHLMSVTGAGNFIQNATKTSLTMFNGSRIEAMSLSDRVRGSRADTLIIDGLYNEAEYERRCYGDVIQPLFARAKRVVIASTPLVKEGLFQYLWFNHPSADRITLKWSDHPDRDDTWCQQVKLGMSPQRWATEFEGQFLVSSPRI